MPEGSISARIWDMERRYRDLGMNELLINRHLKSVLDALYSQTQEKQTGEQDNLREPKDSDYGLIHEPQPKTPYSAPPKDKDLDAQKDRT
ncbi:MAG: hypothetical protein KKC99_01845 [Proteobacteria bacterium]|nr:hypothetical protein [Pseudomonadota bacterium]